MNRTWLILWLALLLTGSTAAAQGEIALAGVYAVRRVVTSSTCAGTVVDGVLANVFMVSIEPTASRTQLRVVVAGAQRFPILSGAVSDGTLTLVGTDGEGGSISVALAARADGTLAGTETITLGQAGSRCTIVRRVTASPVADPHGAAGG